MHEPIPVRLYYFGVGIGDADRLDHVGNVGPTGDVEPALFEFFEPRAQVETQQPSEHHRKIGVTVRIDGQLRGLDAFLTHDAFDGGTRLPLVEHNRLA